LRGSQLEPWKRLNKVYFDTARVEQTDGVAMLLRAVGASRVMLGTHAPFLIPEAALVRCCESELSDTEIRSVVTESASLLRDELSRRG